MFQTRTRSQASIVRMEMDTRDETESTVYSDGRVVYAPTMEIPTHTYVAPTHTLSKLQKRLMHVPRARIARNMQCRGTPSITKYFKGL